MNERYQNAPAIAREMLERTAMHRSRKAQHDAFEIRLDAEAVRRIKRQMCKTCEAEVGSFAWTKCTRCKEKK